MKTWRSILLSRQNKSDAKNAIYANLTWIICSIAWLSLSKYGERGWIYIVSTVMFIIHGYYANKNSKNILFSFRYSLVSILAIGTSIAWSYTSDVFIAPFGSIYQTHEATTSLVFASMLAVSGIHLGWSTARLLAIEGNLDLYISKKTREQIFAFSIIFSYIVVILYIYREGGFVSQNKSYGFDRNSLGIDFGVLNQFILLFVTTSFMVTSLTQHKSLILYIISIGPFILAILSGNRADFLMQLGILTYIFIFNTNKNNKNSIPITKLSILAIILFITTSFLSIWRNVGNFSESLNIFFNSSLFLIDRNGVPLLSLATGNQMLGGYYAIYSKINLLKESFLFGQTYFEYLLMLPPAFLGLPRPPDRAWEMMINGEIMQQGGIYELTEAYWNFGISGAFIIPFIITLALGSILNKCYSSNNNKFFYMTLFITLGLNAPRSIWYQNFSYIRMITVVVFMFITLKCFRVSLCKHPK